jgi:DNA-binding CsgD family transcriptional regulator
MKYYFLLFSLFLNVFYIQANECETLITELNLILEAESLNTDSIYKYWKLNPEGCHLKLQVKALEKIAKYNFNKSSFESSELICKTILDIGKDFKDFESLLVGYSNLCILKIALREKDLAFAYADSCKQIAENIKNTNAMVRSKFLEYTIAGHFGYTTSSLKYLEEARQLPKKSLYDSLLIEGSYFILLFDEKRLDMNFLDSFFNNKYFLKQLDSLNPDIYSEYLYKFIKAAIRLNFYAVDSLLEVFETRSKGNNFLILLSFDLNFTKYLNLNHKNEAKKYLIKSVEKAIEINYYSLPIFENIYFYSSQYSESALSKELQGYLMDSINLNDKERLYLIKAKLLNSDYIDPRFYRMLLKQHDSLTTSLSLNEELKLASDLSHLYKTDYYKNEASLKNQLLVKKNQLFNFSIWFASISVLLLVSFLYIIKIRNNRLKLINESVLLRNKALDAQNSLRIERERQLYRERENFIKQFDQYEKASVLFKKQKSEINESLQFIQEKIPIDLKRDFRYLKIKINGTFNKAASHFDRKIVAASQDYFLDLRKKYPTLTQFEILIINLIALQMDSNEIAQELNKSLRSIESYRARIRKKLEVPKQFSLNDYIHRLTINNQY